MDISGWPPILVTLCDLLCGPGERSHELEVARASRDTLA